MRYTRPLDWLRAHWRLILSAAVAAAIVHALVTAMVRGPAH